MLILGNVSICLINLLIDSGHLGLEFGNLGLKMLNLQRKLTPELEDLVYLSISLLKSIEGLEFLCHAQV